MNGQIEKLKDANSNVGATTQELQRIRATLSQSTDGVSQTLNQFKTATTTLGESVKDNTTNLQKNTGEISKVTTTMQATSATLSNTMQVLNQKTTEVSQETEKLKTTTQGLQQTGKELSQRATEVSQPLNDLKTAANDVQLGRDSFNVLRENFSKLIIAFQTDTATLGKSLKEFVETTMQLKTPTTNLSTLSEGLAKTARSLEIDRDQLLKLLEEFNTKIKNLPHDGNQKSN
jgi:chromosome segregation ATPase